MFREIEQASRVSDEFNLLAVKDKSLNAKGNMVDPNFLGMFSFPLLKGNDQTALSDPYSILLTKELAKNIFGNEEAMGKIIKVNNGTGYKVTGILKDLPNNTQFDFQYLLSYESTSGHIDSDWTDISIRTFVLLKPNASLNAANDKIKNVIVQHSGQQGKNNRIPLSFEQIKVVLQF